MRKALFVSVLVGALAYAAPATAGCWATVQLSEPPANAAPGTKWTAKLTVLQHGRNPLPDAADARPTLTIASRSGERRTFAAKPVDPAKGTYSADVVFPSGGGWTFAVFDDFTSANGDPVPCSRTHEIGFGGVRGRSLPTAAKDAPAPPAESGGFPVWPLGGAFAFLGLAGAVFVGLRARRAAVA
jgi:YtkA-like